MSHTKFNRPVTDSADPRQYNVVKSLENSSALEARASQLAVSKFPSMADGDGLRALFPKESWALRDASGLTAPVSCAAGHPSTLALQQLSGVAVTALEPSETEPTTPAEAVPQMDQVAAALTLCSDLEILLQQKYDPSVQLDRMNNIFPAEYVCSLLSRVGCVARGRGALERVQSGKDNGGKPQFIPIFRPKLFDLRGKRNAVESQLSLLREDIIASHSVGASALVLASRGEGTSTPLLYASSELGCTLVPFMQLFSHLDDSVGNALLSGDVAPRFSSSVCHRLLALRKAGGGEQLAYFTIPSIPIETDADTALQSQLEMGNSASGLAAAIFITPADINDEELGDDPISDFED